MPPHREHRDSRPSRTGHSHARSRSPRRTTESHRHRHQRRSRSRSRRRDPHPTPNVLLPLNAPPISKHDYTRLGPLFASYLKSQKQLELAALEKAEARGRFKRFVSHYNRAELGREWYARVLECDVRKGRRGQEEESSDEEVGPRVPGREAARRRAKAGAAVPGMEDLQLQDEAASASASLARADTRFYRARDRKDQKAALEELVPRADPGSHERKLEKKKEVNEKMRSFRDRSPGAEMEVGESTLMGEDGVDELKRQKAAVERKKNERELRREQILRTRIAEREEKLKEHRAKEEKTMHMFKQMASARFGAGE